MVITISLKLLTSGDQKLILTEVSAVCLKDILVHM